MYLKQKHNRMLSNNKLIIILNLMIKKIYWDPLKKYLVKKKQVISLQYIKCN